MPLVAAASQSLRLRARCGLHRAYGDAVAAQFSVDDRVHWDAHTAAVHCDRAGAAVTDHRSSS
jgi:hypothetical protein